MNISIYELLKNELDETRLLSQTEKLWKTEFGQRHSDYQRSARLVENMLIEGGLEGVERIPFPADGKTVFHDRIMPLCWEASTGKLTVKKAPCRIGDPVVADMGRHPFHLIKGSVSTVPGGVSAKLITYEQMLYGEDPRGAMVIAPPDIKKTGLYGTLCDFGALGVVYDCMLSRYRTPDELTWVNGWSEGPHWHITQDDRRLIGFSVSPRTGDMLRNAVRRGEVIVRAESDGKNFPGEIDVVTGVVPGKEKRELWLLAHLYEPLSSDNSSGVVCAVEIARQIKSLVLKGKLAAPEFTLRLVFGLEMYGFAAYALHRGSLLKDEVIGAMNFDGVPVLRGFPVNVLLSPPSAGGAVDYMTEKIAEEYGGAAGFDIRMNESGEYNNDLLLNDSSVDVPTAWYYQRNDSHHNSVQTMEAIDKDVFKKFVCLSGCWTYEMLSMCSDNNHVEKYFQKSLIKIEDEYRRIKDDLTEARGQITCAEALRFMKLRMNREERILRDIAVLSGGRAVEDAESKILKLREYNTRKTEFLIGTTFSKDKRRAAVDGRSSEGVYMKSASCIVPSRTAPGMIWEQSRAPIGKRRSLGGLKGFRRILSNMDGRKTLIELISEANWEISLSNRAGSIKGTAIEPLDEAQVKGSIAMLEHLTGYGYTSVSTCRAINRKEIISALEGAGLSAGDNVFLHSNIIPFGHIAGGEDAVIDAFFDVIGKEGSLVMPSYTNSFIYFDGKLPVSQNQRPFDISNPEEIMIEGLHEVFFNRYGVLRSPHPSHSVLAGGKAARELIRGHNENDPPCGSTSPFGKLLELGGKLVWFGADISSGAFLHFLEDGMDLPYLSSAVCAVRNPDCSIRAVLIPKSFPGHRDFYRSPGEDTKIYKKLIEEGLEIKRAGLGYGEIKTVDINQLNTIGVRILAMEPSILLCDAEDCSFCTGAKEKIRDSKYFGN